MQEMVVKAVGVAKRVGEESSTGAPVVLLRTTDGQRALLIWILSTEATAIAMKLGGISPQRPQTHDLLASFVEQLGAQVTEIAITEFYENIFYAVITVAQDGKEMIEINARPSDAIALAIRVGAPIYVADDVLEKAGFEFEGEVPAGGLSAVEIDMAVFDLRDQLDEGTAEDFLDDPDGSS